MKIAKGMFGAVLMAALAPVAAAGETAIRFPIGDDSHTSFYVELAGEIDSHLVDQVQAQVSRGAVPYGMIVHSSPGGDVEAAMALGRILRQHQVSVVMSGNCASACVIAVAGAIGREYYSEHPFGLHRPYFLSPSLSFEDAQQRTTELNAEIKQYLSDMNVPSSLLDAMIAVPSDQLRLITAGEAAKLGLLAVDPAYEEFADSRHAANLGISRSEYLARKALFRRRCLPLGDTTQEFCNCVDTIGFRGPGNTWSCDLLTVNPR